MRAKNIPIYYVVIAVLSLLSYFYADLALTLYFQQYKNTLVYDIFKIITEFGRAEYQIIPALLVYIVFRKSNPFVAKIGLAVILSVALAGLSIDVVKFLVGRYRPSMYFSDQLYGFAFFEYTYHKVSFPSGHSGTAFGAMGLLSLVFKRFRLFFLTIGSVVAFSRIPTLHHYISDVLIGSTFGMASSIFIYNRMKLFEGKK
ncbi:MAG: phosphatase PAP2 family protein [Denitrovibrio sp.]|nr:MAG: phosphatase PAP2 family protein [Denitrovibrio sp.]